MRAHRFDGKVAVVTGGTSGVGASTAQILLEEGAKVLVCARREPADDVWRRLNAAGTVTFQKCDVAVQDEVEGAIVRAVNNFGGLDILVNNAGCGCFGQTPDLDPATWHQTVGVNLHSVYYGCRAAIPHMRKRGGGAIVNVASISGLSGDYGFTAYNAAKGAVVNYTRSLAIDHAPEGIRVNAVCPGLIDTPMTSIIGELGLSETWVSSIPLGRAAQPDEIAKVVAFLASDEASFMIGSIVVADGGLSAATGQPNLPKVMAQMQASEQRPAPAAG
ncbi:SDR family NAD(P)-dependent oxidoreductase [Aromatoleum toluclasticum]|uniref:SDR family NAD(P)-dependent oxidoreductase n=1 Tax=Aromatoleum toluclasticum TaxID=92003 RepID=UPI00068909B2|nr:SDR family NAD(P)-dependent oxidoreductase [Aromatoleum toluclasticum]